LKLIEEVEELGGNDKGEKQEYLNCIEEAAARKQARIDSGQILL
jgi:methylmalonyl-CoA mutase N-terminal domain/subunit